ncbi:hypothetical protein [Methylocella tundrae]|uniref:hypothetical protein n=1 Tax=Methylocella tundrae TaxID=227605 RepID=UPI00157B1E09|nr:hypothetical protein [Methylocella tundrae]
MAKELRKAGIHSCNVSVSEGANETGDGDFNFSIPRNNLGSALAVVLDAGRLRIAKDMPAASALAAELESARDGAIGGLSLPVALVTWWCERKASVPLHIINNLFGSIS